MVTIMPPNELVRRAVEWLNAQRAEFPEKSFQALLDEAGCRFNLGPLDMQWLEKIFREQD